MIITREIARKVSDTIKCGLVKGLGRRRPGKFCIEAAVRAAEAAWAARVVARAVANVAERAGMARGDKYLRLFADILLTVLVELKSPGVEFLDLIE